MSRALHDYPISSRGRREADPQATRILIGANRRSKLLRVPSGEDLRTVDLDPAPPTDPIESSAILEMLTACRERGGIDLASGISSTPADQEAVSGAITALLAGANAYSDSRGIEELRIAIADGLWRDNGLAFDPERQLIVTNGVTGGFASSMLALFSKGDEVLVLEPFFGWHVRLIKIAGLVPRYLRLEAPGYALSEQALRSAIGPRTRGLVLCTPANPSGKVLTPAELRIVAKIARERDLRVVTDEQYEHFCFDGANHVSPATVDDLGARTITLGGFSKSMSITGWRLGYAAGPAQLIESIHMLQQNLYICPATPLQHGLVQALGADTLRSERQHGSCSLRAKRDRLCAALERAGFRLRRPEGGFFVLADAAEIAALARSDAAMTLLDRIGVAAVPSRAFSTSPLDRSVLRFCFAKDDAVLDEACARLLTLRPRGPQTPSTTHHHDKLKIRLLSSPADRDRAARLAYEVYVDEFGILGDLADHKRRMLVSDDADHSETLGAFEGDELVGSITTLCHGHAPFPPFYRDVFDLPRLAEICPPEKLALATRLLVVPDRRDKLLTGQLLAAFVVRLVERGIHLVLADCQPHLIALYRSFGLEPFGHVFNYANNGMGIPLVGSLADHASVRERNPRLAALLPPGLDDPAEAARLHKLLLETVPILTSDGHPQDYTAALEKLIAQVLDGPTSVEPDERPSGNLSPFHGFSPEELRRVLQRGAIIRARRGIKLIVRGQGTRTVYVVIEGELIAHHNRGPRTLGPGEICGEIAYLLERRRTADVYVNSDEALVLSLDERTMDGLSEGEPALAARFMGNLARIMAHRLAG